MDAEQMVRWVNFTRAFILGSNPPSQVLNSLSDFPHPRRLDGHAVGLPPAGNPEVLNALLKRFARAGPAGAHIVILKIGLVRNKVLYGSTRLRMLIEDGRQNFCSLHVLHAADDL